MPFIKRKRTFLTGLAIGLITGLLLGMVTLLPLVKKWGIKKLQLQEALVDKKAEETEALRNSSLIPLMTEVLGRVTDELRLNTGRQLSSSAVYQISSLSYSFSPYRKMEHDSLSPLRLSPERGQLLLMLLSLGMDSPSWKEILKQVTFAGADLKEANLAGLHLEGIDLRGANLREADLRGTHLDSANLRLASLWGAHAPNASFRSTDLTRADLSWADLNGANFKSANLQEADLISAQLRNSVLDDAEMRFAVCSGAFLRNSRLVRVNLFNTNFRRANLQSADLQDANVRQAFMVEAVLDSVKINGADFTEILINRPDWLSYLHESNPSISDSLSGTHHLVPVFLHGEQLYRLERIK